MSIFKDGTYYPLGRGEEESMSEYEIAYALCNEPFEAERPPPSPPGKWRVRGGALLEICKMTDEHLRNAISLFMREGRGDEPKIDELRAELARRGARGKK